MSKKANDALIAERLRKLLWDCHTWGKLERAAGVADRLAFWRGKNEEQARTELRAMIEARLRAGEEIDTDRTPGA